VTSNTANRKLDTSRREYRALLCNMQSINLNKPSADVIESKVSQNAELGTVDHEVITLQQQVC